VITPNSPTKLWLPARVPEDSSSSDAFITP